MRNHIILLMLSTVLSSCISVQVPLGPKPKLENIKYEKPNSPFVDLSTDTADAAWISEKTGNTISFLSECRSPFEKEEEVSLDAIKAIENAKIVEKTVVNFEKTKGSQVTALGSIDASKVKLTAVSLKSESCFITITYGGLEKNYQAEIESFDTFKRGFKAP